jgi:hypothetical protein
MLIASRFCGPPRSGNGGYVAGVLAAHLPPGPAAVRLKAPPPLETELHVEATREIARMFDGTSVIAEARPTELDMDVPAPPSFEEAVQVSKSFSGFHHHPFPGCFVCGPARAEGDGLRIFPGVMESRGALFAPWVPDASLADETGHVDPAFVWAALDCTGVFAFPVASGGCVLVLGELAADIDGTITPGERCIAAGWSLGLDGRKRYAGSAVYAADGRTLALARAVWIDVPAADFVA